MTQALFAHMNNKTIKKKNSMQHLEAMNEKKKTRCNLGKKVKKKKEERTKLTIFISINYKHQHFFLWYWGLNSGPSP
jgi:hypothetical protein